MKYFVCSALRPLTAFCVFQFLFPFRSYANIFYYNENISLFLLLLFCYVPLFNEVKGIDRLCKVVELSMQCCGQFFRIHLRHIKRFKNM